jgi:hypothetical protein
MIRWWQMANNGNFREAVLAFFREKVDNLENGARDAAINAGEEIANLTRHHIETRGISKPGRIETGAMLNSVDSRVEENTKDRVRVRAGYFDTPYYTVFQELSTRAIPGTFALTDAAEEVLPKLKRDIDRTIRNA